MHRSLFRTLIACLALSLLAACSGSQAEADPQQAASPAETAPAAPGEDAEQPATQPSRAGQPGVSADVVATVNGTTITGAEITEAMAAFLRGQGMPPSPPADQAEQFRTMILDALIGRELLYQMSVSTGTGPTQEEVDEVVGRLRDSFPTEEAWQAQLSTQGTTEADLRSTVRRNMAIDAVVQRSVAGKIQVSDEEVRSYYDENPDRMQRPEEVRASHILLRVPAGASEEEKVPVRARAAQILAEIQAGGEFAGLAREHSEDTASAEKGGDIGFFRKGMTDPSFEAAAFGLSVQEVSGIVESAFGYHIIKVTDRHEAGLAPFQEVSERLREFLKQRKTQEDVRGLVESLKADAQIEVF